MQVTMKREKFKFLWILLILQQNLCCNADFVKIKKMQAMRWIDFLTTDEAEIDLFFDRLVGFVLNVPYSDDNYLGDHIVLAPGALISNNTVVTSLNPFRKYIVNTTLRNNLRVVVLNSRTITDWQKVSYHTTYHEIACARPVLPQTTNMTLRSTLHDLLVVRLYTELTLLDSQPASYFNLSSKTQGTWTLKTGPAISTLAKRNQRLDGENLKFASIAFKDDLHIWKSCILHRVEFEEDANVRVNCASWLPKEWGYFICIKNRENFRGVGSGAMLFVNEKLVGVGSFAIFKGKESVLVFTDLRVYEPLLHKTCTLEDQDIE